MEKISEKTSNNTCKNKRSSFATHYICKIAVLSAISFILHLLRFPMPFIFPYFLDFQISDMPGVLAGFSMGPVAGCVVIIIKTLLKLLIQGSSFAGIGELADIIIGCSFVLISSLIYKFNKNKKGAVIGLISGSIVSALISVIINRFLLIPFMVNAFGWEAIIGMLVKLFPAITVENFYMYYLPLAILPFNLLRCLISSIITMLIYKRLSPVLHW